MSAKTITNLDISSFLGDEDMTWFCNVIEERAGINLSVSKHSMVKSRLKSHITEYGFQTFEEYKQLLEKLPDDDPEWQVFTNLLTTNKTDFFREPKHFDFLINTIIPKWHQDHNHLVKIWSAAASTGEEAYTLAMILNRYLAKDFLIISTDIDTNVLQKAQNAVYPISKLEEISEEYHKSSIEIGHGKTEGWFRIKKLLKEKVIFKTHNLIGPLPMIEAPFDLVLCRNVLIYFTQDNIDFVQDKIYSHTKKNGYFFTGHSESLTGIKHQWNQLQPAVYKKD